MVTLAINIAAFLFLAYITLIVATLAGATIVSVLSVLAEAVVAGIKWAIGSRLLQITIVLTVLGAYVGSYFPAPHGDKTLALALGLGVPSVIFALWVGYKLTLGGIRLVKTLGNPVTRKVWWGKTGKSVSLVIGCYIALFSFAIVFG